MITRAIIFTLFTTLAVQAQTNWIWQNPLPVGKTLNTGQAFDAQNCYAAGNAGAFIKTTNGGVNWTLVNTSIAHDILSVSFTNLQTGIAGCSRGTILRTTDGGVSFTAVQVDSVRDVKTVQLFADGSAYAAGDKGMFLRSTDGGASWIKYQLDTLSFSTLRVLPSGKAFLAGEAGVIYRSIDRGLNWTKIRENIQQTVSMIGFSDDLNGWATGRNGLVLKTTDGGLTWASPSTGVRGWIRTFSILPGGSLLAAGAPGLIVKSTNGGSTWARSGDSSRFTFNFSAFNENSGWLFGNNGLILHTTDAGANWDFQSEGYENTINSIEFLDPMIGTAVGDSGLILRTEDGGDTWIRQITSYKTNLNDVFFLDTIRGWIVGDDGTILQTLDRGASWQKHDLAHITSDDIYSIEGTKWSNKAVGQNGAYLVSSNSQTGAIWSRGGAPMKTYRAIVTLSSRSASLVGDEGTIIQLVTSPGGGGVIDQSIDSKFDLRDIFFSTGGRGWIVGKYGIVLRSTNSGNKWTIIDTLPVNWLNSVYFYDTLNGYTAGSYGSLFKSADAGYNWTKLPTGVTNTFKKSFFFNKNEGWLVGTYGLLMKTVNGGGSGVPTGVEGEEMIPLPDEIVLYQNHPNPFNPSTTLNFEVRQAGVYRLAVYDMLGREVAELLNRYLPAGQHFASFSGEGLPSGVYIYRLSGGTASRAMKMILLK